MQRRAFLAVAAAGMAYGAERPVRVGVIGTGRRGTLLLSLLVELGAEIPAVCDTNPENLARALDLVEKAGRKRPEGYGGGEDFRKLCARGDLDAVVIASPWKWHTPMAVEAMKQGKYAAVEVPAAQTLEDCWELVNTSERTGVPCMMLENWSFRRDNLAVLNLIRKGLLGDMVHCHCAHSHDCIDHWFWDPQGNERWAAEYLMKRNCDQYPTHSLGPVMSWFDINRGDAMASITSTATGSFGINSYFARKFGPDHPNAKKKFAQGDIVTSVVKTQLGRTIVINYDMQLPRPYDNRWMLQGTLGVYDEDRSVIYMHGHSPKYHEWESFAPFQEQFDHAWWKALHTSGEVSHGGTDALELTKFLEAVRTKSQTPIDVYDSATMSSIVALSGASIAKGSAPQDCPDFTKGKWRTRKPAFGLG